MSDFELRECLQLDRMRFDAALKFLEIKMMEGSGKQKIGDAVEESIALADLLVNTLGTTRRRNWDGEEPY